MQAVAFKMDKQVLLYSTKNCIQYPVINHHGKNFFKENIYMFN